MPTSALPTRDRNPVQLHENSPSRGKASLAFQLTIFLLWAILLGCGAPAWKGSIGVNLAQSSRGVRVLTIPEDSPAREAGLEPNDWLLAIDGVAISNMTTAEDLRRHLSGEVGSEVTLQLLRDEQEFEVRMKRVPYRSASK